MKHTRGSRALVRVALLAGIGLGWFLGAFAWSRFAPFSAARLAQESSVTSAGPGGWSFAPHPLDSRSDRDTEAALLRPPLETVLGSRLLEADGTPLHFVLADAAEVDPVLGPLSMTLQLLDDRGRTLGVVHAGEQFDLTPDGPRVWILARALLAPGETPEQARARIAAIRLPGQG